MVNLEEVNKALKVLGEVYEKYTDRQIEFPEIVSDNDLEKLMWQCNNIFQRKQK
jgi:hypothetical protein